MYFSTSKAPPESSQKLLACNSRKAHIVLNVTSSLLRMHLLLNISNIQRKFRQNLESVRDLSENILSNIMDA